MATNHMEKKAGVIPIDVHANLEALRAKKELLKEALAEREAHINSLVRNIPDLVWLKDINGVYLNCNHAFELFFGATEEEIVGKTDYDFVDKDLADFFRENDHAAMLADKPRSNEEWVTFTSNGQRVLLDTIKTPLRNAKGELIGILGIGRDITERKQAEEALLMSEERYRTVFQTSLDGVTITRVSDGKFLEVNQSWLDLYGYEKDEVIGNTTVGLEIWGYLEDRHRFIEIVKKDGVCKNFDHLSVKKNGEKFWVTLSSMPITLDNTPCLITYQKDITEQKKAEEQLHASHDLLSKLSQNILGFVYQYKKSPEGSFTLPFAGGAIEDYFGITADDATNDASLLLEKIHPDDLGKVIASVEESARTLQLLQYEFRTIPRLGVTKWLSGKAMPEKKEDGNIVWHGFSTDITERKRNERDLLVLNVALNNMSDSAFLTDEHLHFIYANDAACRNLGYTREEFATMTPADIEFDELSKMRAHNSETGPRTFERRHRARDGRIFPVEISITLIEFDGLRYGLSLCRDITERKKHEAELQHVANHDMVTGLPNRRLLTDRLEQAVARAQRNAKTLAVCYLDLDDFKPINDQHGHAVGDQLLLTVTQKLKNVLRAEDTLARLGGDEFVLLFNELTSIEDVHSILDRVLEIISSPMKVADTSFKLSASLGVALYPEDDVDPDTLLRHADQSMYTAKRAGKNRYHLYDPSHDREIQERHDHLQQLHLALEKGEFTMYYQPKVNLVSGNVIGVEALIRWLHPLRGLLSPLEFLPHVEGSDLENAVGEWVIESALEQVESWKSIGLSLCVSVNISARHLLSADFGKRLQAALKRHPEVSPSNLELEIIETAALSDMSQAFDTLVRCKELGVKISLDDFGTGYSSLTHLRQLPVDTLKIDQTFVRDMLTDPSDHGIVLSVVQLAQTFNRKVIAEGVETMDHGAALIELGCSLMQGYGIAHPMPAGQILDWIDQWQNAAIWRELKT